MHHLVGDGKPSVGLGSPARKVGVAPVHYTQDRGLGCDVRFNVAQRSRVEVVLTNNLHGDFPLLQAQLSLPKADTGLQVVLGRRER